MRTRLVVALVCALVFTNGCSGDDESGDNDATTPVTDPGPNPTGDDPGPNDTTGGPVTVQGIVALDGITGCMTLATENGVFALTFTDYTLGDDGAPAIIADDDGRTLAHEGDEMVVSGRPGAPDAACGGTAFVVESLNSATAAT
ncbi:MAG: hypothetical protein ACT4OX_08085 [Actinomycetota bacterium]